MNILHITPHLGGGVGTVIMGWMEKVEDHFIVSLDYINEKSKNRLLELNVLKDYYFAADIGENIRKADIIVIHYWDHPMLKKFLKNKLPECRLVFWCHKNITATMFNPVWWDRVLNYPDLFLNTSPIQGCGCDFIWSTGDMSRFLEIQPKPHTGFNVGYVGTVDYKKLHRNFIPMCKEIAKAIPGVHFIVVGKSHIDGLGSGISVLDDLFTFTGKVDDVAPYLAEMDVFFYPLRKDHTGTCEQVLGESMASGVVPVTLNNDAERLIINHCENGMMAENEMEAVKNIEILYRNPDSRHQMSENARKSAAVMYSINNMIDQWAMVFAGIMEQPKRWRRSFI